MNRRLLYFLLLICVFLSILGLAFHQHGDGVPHDNCSICSYISYHSVLSPQDGPQVSLLPSNGLFISIESTLDSSCLYYHPYSNRAPPA